jgi:predicted transcriptional regulator
MRQTLEILVTPEGKASVQTLGFSGATCREASRFIEQALGQAVEERLTAEFHQGETVNQAGQVRA